MSLNESVVEDADATLAWLKSLGYAVKHGSEIAPGNFSPKTAATRSKNATVQLGKLGLGNCLREGNNWTNLLVGLNRKRVSN